MFDYYWVSDDYETFRSKTGLGLSFARSGASIINLSFAFLLLPICRNIISMLRFTALTRYVPFDDNIKFHKFLGWMIVFGSIVHVAAHAFNALHLSASLQKSPMAIVFATGVGSTGVALVLCFFLIVTSATTTVRRASFEKFWYTHHLYPLVFIFLIAHGSFCFIKADTEPRCRTNPSFYKYFQFSGIMFIIERILREYRARQPTHIHKVIQHPSSVIELQIRKPSARMYPGQYIFLNVPEIGLYEWHPFTLTSAPEEDFLSVHIRVVGDWTGRLAERLGCKWDRLGLPEAKNETLGPNTLTMLPKVMIDGPFGAASDHVFNYEVAFCVGAGMGVTPFASVLKHIWYKFTSRNKTEKLKKVYFIWICRDKGAFEWFQDVPDALKAENLANFLDIKIYLTGRVKEDQKNSKEAITVSKTPTYYGRPNFNELFKCLRKEHQDTNIGVFFCGPKPLANQLLQMCDSHSDINGTKFFFHKENF